MTCGKSEGHSRGGDFGYDRGLWIVQRTLRMPKHAGDSFHTRDTLKVGAQGFEIHRLEALEKQGVGNAARLPFSLKILLENLLRQEDGRFVHKEDIRALAEWKPVVPQKEIAFMPAPVLLQDF